MKRIHHTPISTTALVRNVLAFSGVKIPCVARSKGSTFWVCFRDASDAPKVRDVLAKFNARSASGESFDSPGSLKYFIEVSGRTCATVRFPDAGRVAHCRAVVARSDANL
jgi:hypothetical protein